MVGYARVDCSDQYPGWPTATTTNERDLSHTKTMEHTLWPFVKTTYGDKRPIPQGIIGDGEHELLTQAAAARPVSVTIDVIVRNVDVRSKPAMTSVHTSFIHGSWFMINVKL